MKIIGRIISNEATGGVLLLIATAAALIAENSALQHYYHEFLHLKFVVGLYQEGDALTLDTHQIVNDLLMAIFFLLVGIEIKREILHGHLRSLPALVMPGVAAVAGMAVPAAIYVAYNLDNVAALNGWAIPAATDIAFAVGVLALLGKRVPYPLKIFLLTVAVLDDMGAIAIIALFYTSDLQLDMLAMGAAMVALVCFFNWLGVYRRSPYLVVGAALWYFMLQSGVHATIAGVLLAFCLPASIQPQRRKFSFMGIELDNYYSSHAPALRMQNSLAGWVTFGILPLFAFTNAGVPLAGVTVDSLGGITWGIAAGLLFGKVIGIFSACYLMLRLNLVPLPEGVHYRDYLGIASLCGIGFTMSLFITGLSFDNADFANQARIGILVGSAMAAILGYLYLRTVLKRTPA